MPTLISTIIKSAIYRNSFTSDNSSQSSLSPHLESSHIQEEEYFFHNIHSDWENIIRTIHEDHEHAHESAPIERPMSNDKKV